MSRSLSDYLALPYTIQLIPEDDGSWFVQVAELPGCMSAGDTPDEAVAMIRDAMAGWIEVALEHGDRIPEPRPQDGYSGKFVLRVPTSLHRDLAEAAEREGVSLNQYCNVALARVVGHRHQVVQQPTDEPHELDVRVQAERQAAQAFPPAGTDSLDAGVIRVRRERWIRFAEERGTVIERTEPSYGIR